jgi:pimeloyl-ACP methyl ester carboxylesterase
MENLRMYGKAPFDVAVIHGGPGAAGEMAPVAKELASGRGIIEPIQTAKSLEGQVDELKNMLKEYADFPVVLIGYSWGAWLSFIVTAHHPELVKKLVLVSSGGFKDKCGAGTHERRLERLNEKDRKEFRDLIKVLSDPSAADMDAAFTRLGELVSKADTYEPIESLSCESDVKPCAETFRLVWNDAVKLRKSGQLLEYANHIKCPVVAIHGDFDPHPADGVEKPLSETIKDFRFILLKNCGHKPWIEKRAKDKFFDVLNDELA